MPDDQDKNGSSAASSRSLGERLSTAREAQGLSVEQVAAELHLAENQIEALEMGQFDSLGAPVFVRGHFRKYSDLLKLDTTALLQELKEHYVAADPDQSVIETEVARTLQREKRLTGLIITITVTVLLAILAYLAYRYAVTEPVSSTSEADAVQVVDDLALSDDGNPEPAEPEFAAVNSGGQTLTLPEPEPQIVSEEPEADLEAFVEEVAIVEAQATGNTVSIALSFSEDSWVEAIDADGQRLMFGIGRAGSGRTMEGRAPVSVFFGYADGVEVEVDGEPYPLQNARRRGNTAQISVGTPD